MSPQRWGAVLAGVGMALGVATAMLGETPSATPSLEPAVAVAVPATGGTADRGVARTERNEPVTRVTIDEVRGDVLLPGRIQRPDRTPGVYDWGARSQAFLGCERAQGRTADFAGWFIFLVDASTEEVQEALLRLGARGRVAYSYRQAEGHTGFDGDTRPDDYLQGDSVLVTIRWREGDRWREKAYEDFFAERVIAPDGAKVVKPWTPHFVFHGSGGQFRAKAGCLVCPADCAGGLIANNQMPVYTNLPVLRFDWSQAPPVGTPIEVRLRPAISR